MRHDRAFGAHIAQTPTSLANSACLGLTQARTAWTLAGCGVALPGSGLAPAGSALGSAVPKEVIPRRRGLRHDARAGLCGNRSSPLAVNRTRYKLSRMLKSIVAPAARVLRRVLRASGRVRVMKTAVLAALVFLQLWNPVPVQVWLAVPGHRPLAVAGLIIFLLLLSAWEAERELEDLSTVTSSLDR